MEKTVSFIVKNGGELEKKVGEDNGNTSKREALEVLQRLLTDLAKLIRFGHITPKARTAAARGLSSLSRLAYCVPSLSPVFVQ